jgi:hypothetical protein
MALEYENRKLAAGSMGGTGTEVWGSGGLGAQTGVGLYTITLDQPIDATENSFQVKVRGATPGFATVEQTSDAVKTVHTFDTAGNAANMDFDWEVVQAPSS